ncbi:MAG TPA: ABC transporter permease [Streptosporangiaceae bacterium]|nr:ABC transporter permease [Streptosporangiaceae bacterium]
MTSQAAARPAGLAPVGTELTGTGILTRLALRRDRIMIVSWVYVLAAFAYVSVVSTKKLYPTAASLQAFAEGAGADRVTRAIYGPAGDLHTLGGLATWKLSVFGVVGVAVMSMFIVIRHTRGDEDAGRLELVGAGAVGRLAALTSGLLTALLANLVVALLVAVGLAVPGLPWGDSLAFGLGMAAAGCVFAAITAVAAQLAGSRRPAIGIVTSVIALTYLLRAVGDAASPGSWAASLSWLSPIGWSQQLRPFGPLHWWVLVIPVLFTIAVAAVAYAIAGRRDLGTGLLPVRPGPPAAGASLDGPLGLAWRLQRGTLLAWAAGLAVYGLVIGALAAGIGPLIGNNAAARELFVKLGGQTGLVSVLLAAMMGFMGVAAAIYAVQAALRLRGEESGERAEPVLAAAVGRIRWAWSHLVFAVVGPVVLLVLVGLTTGLVYGAHTGDMGKALGQLLGSALVQLPAVWVLTGIAVALFGLVPRWSAAAWGALVAFLVLTELGSVLNLSRWVTDISPFTHVPKLPGGAFAATPLLWLACIAVALTAVGLVALRRRDLA